MLTVVAIIAVLVAVSIPVINSSLEKSQVTTDTANERAAKGVMLTEYLLAENTGGGSDLFFDNVAGKWTKNVPTAYGKCELHQGCYLKGKISDSGVVEMVWTDGVAKSEPPHSGESLSDNSGGGGSAPPASVVPVGTPKDYGDFTVYGTFQDQNLDETVTFSDTTGVLTIKNDKQIIISNKSEVDQTKKHRIEVVRDISANIVLKNVNIDVSSQSGMAAFKIADNSKGNVTITLEGTNTLKSGENCAGLQKNGNITGIGTLTIKGTGTLNATGGSRGAGIGGSWLGGENSANIMILGGTVSANGGWAAAGIGGSGVGSGIIISGGTVSAVGGYYGAGIGGGSQGSGSNITISGGTVVAAGGSYGAGIGGGYSGAGSGIIIRGGTVSANGVSYGAGIGGGGSGVGSGIIISGGTVTAKGGDVGAGIGGGSDRDGSDITISGGKVTATGGSDDRSGAYGGAGIGGGYRGAGKNITINNNSDVTATGNSGGAGIGGGRNGIGSGITIKDSTVTAIGSNGGENIGSGNNGASSSGSTITNSTINGTKYDSSGNKTS